jgi:MGT family glycosyltransferase
MKVLFACTPVIGHVNPMLVAARVLQNEGHETGFYTGSLFREKVEAAGIQFFPLPADVDFDFRDVDAALPERKLYPPGPARMRFDLETAFVGAIPSQFRGLKNVLQWFPADLVIHETAFGGVLPLLLGPRFSRPASACLGVLALPLPREDGAPFGPGILPATDEEQRKQIREIARDVDETVSKPVWEAMDRILHEFGVSAPRAAFLESVSILSDLILQPCVPGFEYPLRDSPENLHFIGALLPEGSGDVPQQLRQAKDAGKKVVLVSQGTVANGDLGQLAAPVIQALGEREDFLILVTTGGRPIENIPCPLSANTVASEFLNFREILPHVDVLVAFGGYGTVTQALSFGVPMVTAGQSEEKPENGARVAWTGSGVYLRTDNPTVEELREAVDQILSEPSYRARAQELAREFAGYDPARELTRLLEALVADRQSLTGSMTAVLETIP